MKMRVYMSRRLNTQFEMTPIVVETNLAWAVPYWTGRKKSDPRIFWEIA